MRLHLTATSERGKPVTKSGNELIVVSVKNEARETVAEIYFDTEGFIVKAEGKEIIDYSFTSKPKTAREDESIERPWDYK